MFIKCLRETPVSSHVFVDTTMINESSQAILKQLGFEEVFQTCTMYTTNGDAPKLKQEEIFAMTSLEISP